MLLGPGMQAVPEPAGESRREGSRDHPDFRLEYEIPNPGPDRFHLSNPAILWLGDIAIVPFPSQKSMLVQAAQTQHATRAPSSLSTDC